MKSNFLQNHHMPSCQIRIKHNGFVYGHSHYYNFKRWEQPTLTDVLDNSFIKLDIFSHSFFSVFYLLFGLTIGKTEG